MKKNRTFKIILTLIIILIILVCLIVCIRNTGIINRIIVNEPKYTEYIDKYCSVYNLDKNFVCAIINTESSFKTDSESVDGAQGLMQIMPETADWIASKLGCEDYNMFDPEQNIAFGCWYLNFLFERFKNYETVSAAYNAGQNKVSEWLSDKRYSDNGIFLDDIPYMETKNYVEKVKQQMEIYRLIYENI